MKNKQGFTLIEALVFSLICVIVTLTFYRTISSSLKVLIDAKARIAASEVANEKFEILRNVDYENLTTDSEHHPHLPREEEITRSGTKFKVNTEIIYVNDSYDDPIVGSDMRPNDYKQVEVTVSWLSGNETKKINLVTHMAPPGTEELFNGGILSIDIRQSDGLPVDGASVVVSDVTTNAEVYRGDTQSNGKLYLIGLTPGDKRYKISVRKAGYYSVDTVAPYNVTPYDPIDEHASVVLAGIWSQTIITDPLSTIKIKTQDPLGNPIGNIDFALEGGRKLGDTVPDNLPVYLYPQTNDHTDASGLFTALQMSAGKYTFKFKDNPLTTNNLNYEFWKIDPAYVNNSINFFVDLQANVDVKAVLLPKDVPSLFIRVIDENDGTPISRANVTVKNETLEYEKTIETDQFGYAYFPVSEDTIVPLENDNYDVKVLADGYQDEQIPSVSVLNLTKKEITMHP